MSAHVVLSEYNPAWPELFERERRFLLSIIGDWVSGSIEHVGSTAVEGMLAKPVIDIMFGVASLEGSKPAIDVLERNGYCYADYRTEVMHWFCKPSDAFRTHHLYLVPFNSDLWMDRIHFRDLLRADPSTREAYAELKTKLAARYSADREAYTQGKSSFVMKNLRRCPGDAA